MDPLVDLSLEGMVASFAATELSNLYVFFPGIKVLYRDYTFRRGRTNID